VYGAIFGECRTRSVCEIVRTSSGMVARHAGPDGADEHCGGATACMHACHACMHDMHADSPWLCLLASVFSLAATALLLGANTDVFAMSLVAQ
jgi:hypothetical protein